MKKCIASVLLILFSLSIVIAEVSFIAKSDPFSSVQGIELTETEEMNVEGEGFGGALLGAFGGAISGAIGESVKTTVNIVKKTETRTSKEIASDIGSAATYSAVLGGIWGGITNPF